MAIITIRGRREPITIENDRARKIKLLRFGDLAGNGKADPGEMIDLGDEWAGEIGKISSIEISREIPKTNRNFEEETEKEIKIFIALSPEKKGAHTGWFEIAYAMRTGFKKPSEELLTKVREFQIQYFRKNTTIGKIPPDAYGELLPTKKKDT